MNIRCIGGPLDGQRMPWEKVRHAYYQYNRGGYNRGGAGGGEKAVYLHESLLGEE